MKLVNICKNCQIIDQNGRTIIFSYGTPVFSVEWFKNDQLIHRHWSGWSLTTQRHINKALNAMGVCCSITKREWDEMPVEEVDA